jgi:hypothetical protein
VAAPLLLLAAAVAVAAAALLLFLLLLLTQDNLRRIEPRERVVDCVGIANHHHYQIAGS